MTNAETNDKAATVAEQGAQVAPEKFPAKKGSHPEKECAQSQEKRQGSRAQEGSQNPTGAEGRDPGRDHENHRLAEAHRAGLRQHPGEQGWAEDRIPQERRRGAQLPHREVARHSRSFQRRFRFRPGRRFCDPGRTSPPWQPYLPKTISGKSDALNSDKDEH